MIHAEHNTCPICLVDDLTWDLNYKKSQVEMFKCGHGSCKCCYKELRSKTSQSTEFKGYPLSFSCPICRGDEQLHTIGFLTTETNRWTTFSEWYSDYEIYIKAGTAKNVVKNSTFGKQLIRLIKENKEKRKNKNLRGV